jgi:hypothetical protein
MISGVVHARIARLCSIGLLLILGFTSIGARPSSVVAQVTRLGDYASYGSLSGHGLLMLDCFSANLQELVLYDPTTQTVKGWERFSGAYTSADGLAMTTQTGCPRGSLGTYSPDLSKVTFVAPVSGDEQHVGFVTLKTGEVTDLS